MPETDFALYCGQSFLRADVILAATFYFHDYETWGADPKKDRPAQFGGIRTDLDLNPIGEPDMWYCQLANDYLPHPVAAHAPAVPLAVLGHRAADVVTDSV